jgi:AraC-like DNA-binding protein
LVRDANALGFTLSWSAGARLSPYYFARQFKRATGLPPHQYVIARGVERAQPPIWDQARFV